MRKRTRGLHKWHIMIVVLLATLPAHTLSAQVDAVFANDGQPNRVCLGDGLGGYSCSDVSSDSFNSRGVALGFIDSDANLDAIFANSGQRIRVCLGDGSGNFSCSDTNGMDTGASGVALGFVNGDDHLDAVFLAGPLPQVCLGDGNGDFDVCLDIGVTPPFLGFFTDVALGLVDGDNNLDVIFGGIAGPAIKISRVCLGDGTGGFSCVDSPPFFGGSGLALGFVDGDGNLDVVFATGTSDTLDPLSNILCLGDGEGDFSCSAWDPPYAANGVTLGFFDGDDILDAIFLAGPPRICLGNGSGFDTCSKVSGIDFGRRVALDSVDGDDNLDAVFARFNQPNLMCLGDGKGDFVSCSSVSEDSNSTRDVALGQLRGIDSARFRVSKDFSDNNAASIEVTLSCNTGLPLEQTTTIAEGDPVNFVVGDFEPGTLDCTVSEVVPAGYSANYDDGDGESAENCSWLDLQNGQYACQIENNLEAVEVEVTKVWIDENPQFNPVNIAEAEWVCQNLANQCDGVFCNASGTLHFNGNPDTEPFHVLPDWQTGTHCSITEVNLPDGGIEVTDNECQDLLVFPGQGASCTIYNTRLYEGIPTLSRYGLGILVLMMLGLGFVTYRRLS